MLNQEYSDIIRPPASRAERTLIYSVPGVWEGEEVVSHAEEFLSPDVEADDLTEPSLLACSLAHPLASQFTFGHSETRG